MGGRRRDPRVAVGKVVGLWGRRLGAGAMQYRLQARYRREVTRRYLALPLSWHHRHPTGTLLSNANADVESAWYPIAPLPFAVGTVVMLVAAVAALFATDWVLALVGCAVFPALLGVNVVYSRRMAPRAAAAQRLRAEVSAVAHESFDGALVVKTMGREAAETERFAGRTGELRDALIRVGRIRGLFDPFLEALPSLGTLAVLRGRRVAARGRRHHRLRGGQRRVPVHRAGLPGAGDRLGAGRAAAQRRRVGPGRAASWRPPATWRYGERTLDAGDRPAALRFDGGRLRLRRRPAGAARRHLRGAGRAHGRAGRADRQRQVDDRVAGRAAGRPDRGPGRRSTAPTCAT